MSASGVRIRVRKIVPLKAGAAVQRRFAAGCRTLIRSKPRSARAARAKADLEHLLLRLITGSGLLAAERVVGTLRGVGIAASLDETGKGRRGWNWLADDGRCELTIRVWSSPALRAASVWWSERRVVVLSPRESARDERQQAFYAAFESIGAKACGPKPPRLNARDKTILLVGELEADVNNGGFGQYVGNKGRKRAGEALRALRSIGAKRTAVMLQSALEPGVSDAALEGIDRRFYDTAEDLALLTVRSQQVAPAVRTI